MTKSIVIFNELEKCLDLLNVFKDESVFLSESLLILPSIEKITPDQQQLLNLSTNSFFRSEEIKNIRVLNPKLDRKIRQKNMRTWLMPFGFIAGIAFSNMTNLSTFSFLGLNNIGESFMGGLLGMGSGYLGSIVSSATVSYTHLTLPTSDLV